MSTYKVLVVDDSAFMRKIISDLIMEDPQFEVIGTAKNGREALEMTRELQPDVITMDVAMPIMNGLEAVQIIMNENPIPIIMLSSMTGVGTQETIQALELGAIDFVRKPSGSISLDLHIIKEHILDKLKIAVSAKVRPLQRINEQSVIPKKIVKPSSSLSRDSDIQSIPFRHVVAIGTSTGGPRALQTVLSGLPSNFPAPVLIVQHMPPNFTKSLAIRLDTYCSLHVVEAEDGMKVSAGTVYVAPGGLHMSMIRVKKDHFVITLNKEEPRSGHRPSVEVLFESLIPLKEFRRHIIIMTGMGSDGAKTMKMLKESGANTTIAESEETCIVFGMPRAAIELGGVDYILKQQDISNKLVELVQ
ncbi:MAG: chemotaxis response regulator protein-glutamate methylesterase [Paenibacillaceae bacterium]